MIRINLLPRDAAKRKKAPAQGQLFGAILIGALLVEVLLLYLWQSSINDDVIAARRGKKKVEKQTKVLEERKAKADKLDASIKKLKFQQSKFLELQEARTGPLEALMFLGFITTPQQKLARESNDFGLAMAGWNESWKSSSVWLTEIKQRGYEVTFKGVAHKGKDVAEFYRRLETGIYFVALEHGPQEEIEDEYFEDMKLVQFEGSAALNFNRDGVIKVLSEDLPERLAKYVKQEAPAKGSKKGAKKKKKKED